MNISAEL